MRIVVNKGVWSVVPVFMLSDLEKWGYTIPFMMAKHDLRNASTQTYLIVNGRLYAYATKRGQAAMDDVNPGADAEIWNEWNDSVRRWCECDDPNIITLSPLNIRS